MDFAAQLRAASQSIEEDPRRIPQVVTWFEQLATKLEGRADAEGRLMLGQVLVQQGNLFSRLALRESQSKALSCYQGAAEVLAPSAQAGNEAAIAELAGAYGNRARVLQDLDGEVQLEEAIQWSKAAVDLFSRLPWETSPRYGHNLIAAIFNLAGLHDLTGDSKAAVATLDSALDAALQLQAAGAEVELLLGEVWLNRGNLVLECDPVDALLAWTAAVEMLQRLPGASARQRFALAGAMANQANLMAYGFAGTDAAHAARTSARLALTTLGLLQKQLPEAADVALRANWAICGALGQLLFDEAAPRESLELYEEATDAVESALSLIQIWNRNGRDVPLEMTSELFRFGCDLYWRLDPGFLIDFISETLEGFDHSGEVVKLLKAEADFAVARCIEDLEQSQWIVHGSTETERLLAMLNRLREFQQKLAA